LGLFRNSALVENDERDREALAAASKLARVAVELTRAEDGLINTAQPSADELRRLGSSLSQKLWGRREELSIVSRRLAAKLLDQTAQRLSLSAREASSL
jgi:hypothetical protein